MVNIRRMADHFNNIIPQKNVSKIIGIQFSILSPDEIRKASVAEITSPVPAVL